MGYEAYPLFPTLVLFMPAKQDFVAFGEERRYNLTALIKIYL